jgi:molybdopterin/thiamine biosynthesis adenylyltransferase
VTLIDRDVYAASNLPSQDFTPAEVRQAKAVVQARRLRRINPELQVRAYHAAVEDVPLGVLQADVILAAVDGRAPRQYLNEAAWRLGVPLIDTGVETSMRLGRVEVIMPAEDQPCLECGWDANDYALAEQSYACGGSATAITPTNGSSSLGALVASMQIIEAGKLLRGEHECLAAGQQIAIDARWHKCQVTRLVRNPQCRFDHRTWPISEGPPLAELTVERALALAGEPAGGGDFSALRCAGRPFVRAVACAQCGARHKTLRVLGRLRATEQRCAGCGGTLIPVGFELVEQLERCTLPRAVLAKPLRGLGFRVGDVCCIRSAGGEERFFMLGDRSPRNGERRGSARRQRPDVTQIGPQRPR